MNNWIGLLVLAIIGGFIGTLLVGSIIAMRGARNWTTILQLCGTGTMLAGGVLYGLSVFMYMSSFPSPGPGSGSYGSQMEIWEFVMKLSGIAFLAGLVLFTGGYVGMCGKYGAAHRRSQELEGLVGQLQERIQDH